MIAVNVKELEKKSLFCKSYQTDAGNFWFLPILSEFERMTWKWKVLYLINTTTSCQIPKTQLFFPSS